MSILETATTCLLTFTIIVLAAAVCFCLFRGLLGPRFTDRIISVNLIGTKTIILICVLSVLIGEHYLVDVALIYSLISFLAVVVLVNIYITVYNKRKAEKEGLEQDRAERKEQME